MVKGRIYKLANLDKNKRNNYLISYKAAKDGLGWLWTSNYRHQRAAPVFKDGDAFVCLGKMKHDDNNGQPYYGITPWYEAVGPDGKVHRITPAMRSSYFRSP